MHETRDLEMRQVYARAIPEVVAFDIPDPPQATPELDPILSTTR